MTRLWKGNHGRKTENRLITMRNDRKYITMVSVLMLLFAASFACSLPGVDLLGVAGNPDGDPILPEGISTEEINSIERPVRELTPTTTPYPSPTGRIAFVSSRDGNNEIYVSDIVEKTTGISTSLVPMGIPLPDV
jgi:hypothetical protein